MIKSKYIAASLAGAVVISAGAIGVVSAATPSTAQNPNVGTSGIQRAVFKQEKLDAVASVLNTTTANVQTARTNKDLKQLIANAGLTKVTFHEKVKATLTTDLESKGYSQDQVTIALQQKTIHRLRHHK
jgi:hypothetical protein